MAEALLLAVARVNCLEIARFDANFDPNERRIGYLKEEELFETHPNHLASRWRISDAGSCLII